MDEFDENRVPKTWVGREVTVKTYGLHRRSTETFGKLEDVHEGGVVLSQAGPAPEVAEMGPTLFYPWSAIEVLRLRVAPPEQTEAGEGSHGDDRARAISYSQRFGRPITSRALEAIVPIAQRRTVAGIVVTLRSLEIYEGGHGLIGYLVAPEPGEEHLPPRHSFPEVRIRDDLDRPYEVTVGNVRHGSGGELWLAGLPGDDAEALEVEVVRLFLGPSGRGRVEYVDGPWAFRFPLR